MDKELYDVALIGAGPGGYVAAIRCAQLGLKTVCIDKRPTLGGTCLNVGCIPSKALLLSSEYFAWLSHEADQHGIGYQGLELNFAKMQARKEGIVKKHVEGIATLFKKNKLTFIQGEACFLSANRLEISHQEVKKVVEANSIIIATGSEPIPLPFLPFNEQRVVSSTGALALAHVPKTLLIVGAGVIGLEIASVYQRLGTQVKILERQERICPMLDEAISKMLLTILKKQGLEFYPDTKVNAGFQQDNQVTLVIEREKEEQLSAEIVLVAIGRKPYTDKLKIENADIRLNKRGFIEIDSSFRTGNPHIYAIGDVIEGPMLAHKASDEGIAVAEIIAGLNPTVRYATLPNVIYTHPEVANVGLTEEEAKLAGLEIRIGLCQFKVNSRASCNGYTEGMVKIIGEAKTDQLIGLHIIGPQASEMIHEGVIAMENKMTLTALAHTWHAHPTLSESIKEAALNAYGKTINF